MEEEKSLATFDNLLNGTYGAFIIWIILSIFILAQLFVPFIAGVAVFLLPLTILLLLFALVEGFRTWLQLHNGPEPRKTQEVS